MRSSLHQRCRLDDRQLVLVALDERLRRAARAAGMTIAP
jgi:anti-anti-sigma regulatory factor